MGSKRRIAKYILPIILKDRKENQWYIEPFCGACNSIEKVEGRRIANDVNEYLISLFKALQKGWVPPDEVSEELYRDVKRCKHKYSKELVGFIGFCCSFGGMWFSNYARGNDKQGKSRNYAAESKRSLLKSLAAIKGIKFFCNRDYRRTPIYEDSIIYCDPPYRGTCGYGQGFDYLEFYDWCRAVAKFDCKIYISEYWMPPDFKCVWEKEINSSLGLDNTCGKRATERLYII